MTTTTSWTEQFSEGVPKLVIEDTVDDRVHRAVEVPQPREDGKYGGWYAPRAERPNYVDGEERGPAEQEDAHDNPEGNRCFVLGGACHPGVRHNHRDGQGESTDVGGVHASVAIEPGVDEDHDKTGGEEADDGGPDGVGGTQRQLTDGGRREGVSLVGTLVDRSQPVPAEVYRDEGDESGQDPDEGDARLGPSGRHESLVVEWPPDVDVAIQADGAEVQDGGRRTHDVRGDPYSAEDRSEDPLTPKVVHKSKGHDEAGDKGVRHRQGNDEVVARLPQVAVQRHRCHDNDVAKDGERDEYGQNCPDCGLSRPHPIHIEVTCLATWR